MSKLIAISFFCIYLFSTTELSQLLKMPVLVEHFIEHRNQNSDITLGEFLYMHYAMGNVKDADYQKDMQLPFKTYDNHLSSILNIYIPLSTSFSIPQQKQVTEEKTFAIKEEFLFTIFLSNIWQPPRV